MRQANSAVSAGYNLFKALVCVFLLLFCGITQVNAEITALSLTATPVPDSPVINSAGSVKLEAKWESSSPPFTVTFQANGSSLYSQSGLTETTLSYTAQGSALAPGVNRFMVQVTDASGTMPASALDTVTVDNTTPLLTATLLTTGVITGSSQIRVQITSTSTIKAPTVTCQGVTGAQEGSMTTGTSFIYTLQLNGFANGSYMINVKAKNTSEPESSAPEGSTTCSFTVGTNVSGNTSIDGCSVTSPTNSTVIMLNGTAPEGAVKLEISDGGSMVTSVNLSSTAWNVSVTLSEGEHSLVAVSKDSTDTIISQSTPWPMVVDVTPPGKPSFETGSLPATTNQTSVTIPVSVEGFDTDVAAPVFVQALVNGTPVGAPVQVTSASVGVTVPLSPGANTITFMATDSADNTSEVSSPFVITMSSESSLTVSSILIDTYPVPVPATVQLSAGSHQIAVYFTDDVDTSVMPSIDIDVARYESTVARVSAAGSYSNSKTFVGTFALSSGSDGNITIKVSGVKDKFGSTMAPYEYASSFVADTTPPSSSFSSMAPIVIAANSPNVALSGTVTDSGSGIGYVEVVYKNNSTLEVGSISVPIMGDSPSPWNYQWAPSLPEGAYNLWVRAADRAQLNPNVEPYENKAPRQLTVDTSLPTVTRVSLNYMTDDVDTIGSVHESVNRVVAQLADTGGSGVDGVKTEIAIKHESGSIIPTSGPYPLDANTVYVTFTPLSINGTYTITVRPFDLAGNVGETASRSFVLNTAAPDNFVTSPANGAVANETQEALAQSQVWATITDSAPDYTKSKIEVKYSGNTVSKQVADTSKLIASIHNGALKKDQSHDGRYDVIVVCANDHSVGAPADSYFIYDSMPPIITGFSPHINLKAATPTWVGKDTREFSITVSDAPKDIIAHAPEMPLSAEADNPFEAPQVSGDSSWYNGSGSGINLGQSSFRLQIEGQEPVEGTLTASTFSVQRPEAAAQDLGAVPINITAVLKDNANDGEAVPNSFTASYSYMFDYLSPEVKVKTGSLKSKKFKSALKLTAHVKDMGTSSLVKVAGLEYSLDDGVTWNAVSSPGLPAKEADAAVSIPLKSLSEGSHTLLLRAKDLAGNMSDLEPFSFEVDRTGPARPEMVFPIPEQITKIRSQLCRWQSVADADKYLLQVSSDPSFNNVVNGGASSDYAGLTGQAISGLSGNASINKDGCFYWRVAGIEELGDGYNLGVFSETRCFYVDTVRPAALSVVPAPTSANKVSSGMVTFTIRFNENMDVTYVPEVVLTSAGGEVMKVEQVSYKGDTWVGTTVIPKDNSAAYNGTAVLSIGKATDLAGNVMSENSDNSIVIDTAPVFEAKIFTNPVNKYEIMIVVRASESLQGAPSCSVQQSSAKMPIVMNFLKDRFYAGSYTINTGEPGKAYIDLSGTDLYGITGYTSVQFIVADISASKRLNITTDSGMASLKGAESSTYADTSIYMIDRGNLDSPFEKASSSIRGSLKLSAPSALNELVGVLPLEEIGPSDTRLKKCLLYTAKFDSADFAVPSDKIGLYRLKSNGTWVYQGGKAENGAISAQLNGLGRLALMADMTSPALADSSIKNLEELKDEYPEISGEITDLGSGVDRSSFKLYIDNIRVNGVGLDNEHRFSYKVKRPLARGKHEVRYEALDNAGNALKKAIRIASPGPFQLNDFMPYPNPARGNKAAFAYDFGQAPDAVSLKIYDSAGHRVISFNEADFVPAAKGFLRWNLRNLKGKRVANGVYFYKLKVVKNGKTLKKSGKLAVLN